MSDLGDKLAALGFRPSGGDHKAPERVTDFRNPASQPNNTSDIEAAMTAKLSETVRETGGPADRVQAGRRLPRDRMAGVSVETRKRSPARAVDPSRLPSKSTGKPRNPTGKLTPAARERLHSEQAPACGEPVDEAPPVEDAQAEKTNPFENTEMEGTGVFAPSGAEREMTFEEAFVHVTSLVGKSTPQIEDRPADMSDERVSLLNRRISRGAQWLRDNPDPDEIDGYVVGFDFGTSSLKIVVREPWLAGNDVAALEAPEELRSLQHPYLWQTAVWFEPAGSTFHLHPVPGAKVLEGFKTGIVGGNGSEAVWDDPEVSRSEAATAFIALHLCHLMGWFHEVQPLSRSTAKNYLSINIGVPVATQDNPAALAPFEEVIRAAVELSRTCEPVTLANVRDALACSRDEAVPHGFCLIPELSAALVGYATDPTSPWGSHVLIDVGASTLDIVAFNLIDNQGQPEIKAFAASVELLGAAALEVARAAGIADADFSKACNKQFGNTYDIACQDNVAASCFSRTANPNRRDVRLVITGGGCATSVHSEMIKVLPGRLLGPQTPARPEPPQEIARLDCDRSRLLLAFGLAHDHPDIPHPTLPSAIPPIVLRPRDCGPSMVGPEQT